MLPEDSEQQLRKLTRSLTEKYFPGCNLAIGKVVKHPKGYLVKITDGQYWGTHGLSNFWRWRRVKKDGSLAKKEESGYGW